MNKIKISGSGLPEVNNRAVRDFLERRKYKLIKPIDLAEHFFGRISSQNDGFFERRYKIGRIYSIINFLKREKDCPIFALKVSKDKDGWTIVYLPYGDLPKVVIDYIINRNGNGIFNKTQQALALIKALYLRHKISNQKLIMDVEELSKQATKFALELPEKPEVDVIAKSLAFIRKKVKKK